MKTIPTEDFVLYDHDPAVSDFRADVLEGLPRRSLPCKYFYDERGSKLFERICELPEYYPTRTELAILESNVDEIVEVIGPRCRLIEFGSGNSTKVRLLLDHLVEPAAYVPVEISREHMLEAATELKESYPDLLVQPVCADYTEDLKLPPPPESTRRTVCFFPGSTIGNFTVAEAEAFLGRIARMCGSGGGLLIGADLQKDEDVLVAAYDDSQGVTAEFNLNVLRRMREELGADLDLSKWRHRAIWDAEKGRIEIQLVSLADQTIRVAGKTFRFAKGEHITTEYSHKYTLESFAELVGRAGFEVDHVWTDSRRYFSVQFLGVQ